MSRAGYAREIRTAATYPVAMALTEGSFASVVAIKYFNASALLVSIIVAAPMFGNIIAVLWAQLAERRSKIRLTNQLQIGIVMCVLAVALTALLPKDSGAWAFAVLMVGARLLASGIVTIRSYVWRMNYPKAKRGRIVARIIMITTLSTLITAQLGMFLIDRHAHLYWVVYVIGAVLGVVGVRTFAGIRIRGERKQLKDLGPIEPMHPLQMLVHSFADARKLLREDHAFRQYQTWQMCMGFSFLMMTPALYTLISKQLTNPARDYLLALTVAATIPDLTRVIFTQIWAPIFDRMDFSRFRFYQSLIGLSMHVLIFAGALLQSLWVIAIATFVMGISNAAGNLAWNLGQNAFAPRDQIGRYMGVHVMLTGLRGCVAPFLGAIAFYTFSRYGGPQYTFVLPVLLSMVAVWGFWSMMRAKSR
jgi:MFS family permease